MDDIQSIVQNVFKQITEKTNPNNDKLQRVWDSVLRADSKFTKILALKEGVLFVNVDHSARCYKFKIRKVNIVKAIKEELPELIDIVFKIGPVK